MLTVAQVARALTIEEIASAIRIPSGRIRKWLFRGKVHRDDGGRVNIRCVMLFAHRGEMTDDEYNDLHAACCKIR